VALAFVVLRKRLPVATERERTSAKGNSKILQAHKSRRLGRLTSDIPAIIGLIWPAFKSVVAVLAMGPSVAGRIVAKKRSRVCGPRVAPVARDFGHR